MRTDRFANDSQSVFIRRSNQFVSVESSSSRRSNTSAPALDSGRQHPHFHRMPPASAGYSGTPLAKKLGIGADSIVATKHAPPEYHALLSPLPPNVTFSARVSARTDVVHGFYVERKALAADLAKLRTSIRGDAAVWVSWPKKSAKVPTDITEDVIRAVALPMGFVDIKVCAVSDVWSGLKLVIRKELR